MRSKIGGEDRAISQHYGVHRHERGFGFLCKSYQKKRTDNPSPADERPAPLNDRPAPVNAHSVSYPHNRGGNALLTPEQNCAPQHERYPYAGQPAYPPPQDRVSRHNTSQSPRGFASNQNTSHLTAKFRRCLNRLIGRLSKTNQDIELKQEWIHRRQRLSKWLAKAVTWRNRRWIYLTADR